MTDWISILNFTISASAMMLMIIGLLFTAVNSVMDRKNKRFFLHMFSVLFLYILSNLLNQIIHVSHFPQISLFCESFFSSLLMPMLICYMLDLMGFEWSKSRVFRITAFLWVIYFILLVITQFTTFIYYYSPDNEYHRGPWYPLLLVPPVLIMLISLAFLIRNKNRLSRKQYTAFLIYYILPTIAMILMMKFYGLYPIVIGTTISVLFMLVFISTDQMEKYVRQQAEIARKDASIAVLEMRPHFIFNTMTSIYYLCGQDVDKARQVILDFTTYLRSNFSAIAHQDMIPFQKELEHTQAYLAVEQVRFEEKLFVEFDTDYMLFRVPPLTLQPIVENAVKHGIDPELGPLTITIRTRDLKTGSEIIVEDNGPGFAPADDSGPHIALKNIRKRLELMCGGTLSITSGTSGGTTVRIFIPRKE